jgi:murein L,D-transpeptidase YcbB/YkuD
MIASIKARTGWTTQPVRTLLISCTLATASLGVSPLAAAQAPFYADAGELREALRSLGKSDRQLRLFYERRNYQPVWTRNGTIDPSTHILLGLIETAELDGLDSGDFRPRALGSAIRKAGRGSPEALAKAEIMLSRAFTSYARAVRAPRKVGMVFVDQAVVPSAPSQLKLLEDAAASPSLEEYVESGGWVHPIYMQLREALASRSQRGPDAQVLRLNMDRARVLPGEKGRRYVLVDAAGSRLWMYEGREIKDTMRVVVGKPDQQTPMMAGMIRYATLNPYWNIPPDLVQTQVASNVLSKGIPYLKGKRYEVLSDWSEKPKVLNPAKIDWQAVADGQRELRVRQLPGKGNAMGRMKFMFPNDLGIYLHDTAEKELLKKSDRQFSSGCVRLEDAPRLARWLFGKPLVARSAKPEQQVNLPEPVPVYITYLTAVPEGERIAFRPDVYGRDGARLGEPQDRSLALR